MCFWKHSRYPNIRDDQIETFQLQKSSNEKFDVKWCKIDLLKCNFKQKLKNIFKKGSNRVEIKKGFYGVLRLR